jgi:hypothetical protein
LYRIARDVLLAVGNWQLRTYAEFAKRKALEPMDPFMAGSYMASQFIPYINAYVDQGGQFARAEMGLQDADDWMIDNPFAINAARNATLDLCQETVDNFIQAMNGQLDIVRREISEAIEQGETAGDTVNRVAQWMNEDARWRARRVAVTESARAFNRGQVASTEDLDFVAGYKLVLSSDACPLCHAIKRLCPVIPKGGSFGENGKNPTYKRLTVPPFHPNCVLGETPIRAASIVSASHAKYQGPIVRIECSDGSRMSVTANHMLLTPTGFARAIDLVQGDDVIRTSATPVDFSVPSGASPNNDDRPPTAEKVFRSLVESGGVTTTHVPVSAEYLHGDAAFVNGDIHIVRPNRLLWRDGDTFLNEPCNHFGLVNASDFALRFNRFRNLASVLDALRLATDGGVSRLREFKSIFWAGLRHPYEHRLRSVSLSDAKFMQSANNYRAADAERIGKAFDGLPRLVTTAKIIDIDIVTPHEPVSVYDFETEESMYIIDNGIISSNCRCTLVTVFDDEVPDNWPQPAKPDESGYIKPTERDIIDAEEGGYQSVQIGNAKSVTGFVLPWGGQGI